ncbi:MAG: crosslink repair DNA glycosylase YcaQ family protein [Rudaea sp.]
MTAPILAPQQARNLMLAAQGLLVPARARAKRASLLAAIERMRLLQIDTIHVVARSPFFVLFARLGHYEPRWLDELLARGAIFECWAHEACFAPMGDLPLHRGQHERRAGQWWNKIALRVQSEHAESVGRLLSHIREHGAVKSSDFARKQKGAAGWWGWKDEKRWLESAFAMGELMVARREGFQRVYDLSERVLAQAKHPIPDASLTTDAIRREHALGAVRALGIAQARWVADYFRSGRRLKDTDLDEFVSSGELMRVAVRGWEQVGYVHRDQAPLLDRAERGRLKATHTCLLSPFDPVVWDRERASTMFGFDYTLECYTPEAKRRYGYFVLPILRRGRLVGRLDAKAHRKEGSFEVKAIFLEPGVAPNDALAVDLAAALLRTAAWHGTPRVVIRRSDPRTFAALLRTAIAMTSGSGVLGEGGTPSQDGKAGVTAR